MKHFDDQTSSSMMSPSSSLLLSEPPDLRNWFSSYVYESPLLDKRGDFEDFVSREGDCEKDEGINLGKFEKESISKEAGFEEKVWSGGYVESNGTSDGSSFKFVDSLQSSCLVSEPPDIGNWFSSYAYESPEVSTADEFDDSASVEKEICTEETDMENRTTRKSNDQNEEVILDKLLQEKILITKDSNKAKDLEIMFPLSDLHFEKKTRNTSGENDISSSTKYVGKTSLNREVASASKPKQEVYNNPSCLLQDVDKRKGDNEGKHLEKSAHTTFVKHNIEPKILTRVNGISSESVTMSSGITAASVRESTFRSNGKESEQKEVEQDGFVTTKKRMLRGTDKKSLRKSQEVVLNGSRNKVPIQRRGENGVGLKRKVLTDTTNVQQAEDSVEITGKWLCPQKNKSNTGPPLKQLRLERWVKRVQNG